MVDGTGVDSSRVNGLVSCGAIGGPVWVEFAHLGRTGGGVAAAFTATETTEDTSASLLRLVSEVGESEEIKWDWLQERSILSNFKIL